MVGLQGVCPARGGTDYKRGQSGGSREAFGVGLKNRAAVNPKVYAVDGDVKNSTFTETLQKAFPDRLVEGFIAEQNMVSVGVGMAAQGLGPVFGTVPRFLSPAFHQGRQAGIHRRSSKRCGPPCGRSP